MNEGNPKDPTSHRSEKPFGFKKEKKTGGLEPIKGGPPVKPEFSRAA